MKKIILPIACCALAFVFLFSCARHGHCADGKINVLASTFPVYLFALNVCADIPEVEVGLLIPAAAGCPHDFALRPQDANKLSKADILIVNGAGLEDFLEKTLKNLAPGVALIDASKGIRLMSDDHGHPNSHIFASPRDAALMSRNIGQGMAKADSERASLYEKNADAYATALEKISEELEKIGAGAENKGIAIEHDALAYLAENANLDIMVMIEHGDSAARLSQLKKDLLEKKPQVLAGDSQFSDRLLQTLAKETDIPFIRLDPCAGGPENPPLDYYQTVMEGNLKVLEDSFDKRR